MPVVPLLPRSAAPYVRALAWIAIAWIVVFWRLGEPSMMDPDEAHYAELTREMLRAGIRPPEEFTRPEVADILIRAMAEKAPVA